MKKIIIIPVLVVVTVMILVNLAGILVGLLIMATDTSCEAPCDGSAMAAGAVWSLAFAASLVLAFLLAIGTTIYLRVRNLG